MKEHARAVRRQMRLENLPLAEGCGQRDRASRQALGEAHDIGRNAGLLAGEQRSGPPEASHHLIGNEQHAIGLADALQLSENASAINEHAPGAKNDRLQEERRRPLLLQIASKASTVRCSRPAAGNGRRSTSNSSGS